MITVLGAGVAGLCAATALAEQGMTVEVVTPADAPDPVSGLAGGMLAPFCEGDGADPLVTRRGQQSIAWWSARVGSFQPRGTLVLAAARDRAELDRFARATQNHRTVRPDDLEPDLSGRFARGLFFADEGHLDPAEAMASLRSRLTTRGVRFHHGPHTGSRIVDCRGWSARADLPDLRGVRGEMLELFAPQVALTRTIRLLHPRFPCYIVPRGQHRYMIGATMVETADGGPITARALMELLSAAYAVHPGFAEARLIHGSAGLRPAFPDNIPALRRAGDRIHMNGMHRHGFLMAPVLATDLAQQLCQEVIHAN